MGYTPFHKEAENSQEAKIFLKPGNDLYQKVAVASRGKGVLLIDATERKLKEL